MNAGQIHHGAKDLLLSLTLCGTTYLSWACETKSITLHLQMLSHDSFDANCLIIYSIFIAFLCHCAVGIFLWHIYQHIINFHLLFEFNHTLRGWQHITFILPTSLGSSHHKEKEPWVWSENVSLGYNEMQLQIQIDLTLIIRRDYSNEIQYTMWKLSK